ncbi:hypothetical protein SAMN02745945_02949 [Peptoclostridium litorale DSM 5388]|uniref:Uncharacterized protein n=1 Tax=Peptoclostridium litorale DSM 5388 TaxID=1121324 RepID=A0A069RJ21_PEPLI|nr:hypothetical protein CLIT_20p00210 [Peptoclostridium litorale DSM 5388]SIO36398.1 hypothetical protein SAMN02745945_02949 [Peptoclostridium litorale DSM 5388]
MSVPRQKNAQLYAVHHPCWSFLYFNASSTSHRSSLMRSMSMLLPWAIMHALTPIAMARPDIASVKAMSPYAIYTMSSITHHHFHTYPYSPFSLHACVFFMLFSPVPFLVAFMVPKAQPKPAHALQILFFIRMFAFVFSRKGTRMSSLLCSRSSTEPCPQVRMAGFSFPATAGPADPVGRAATAKSAGLSISSQSIVLIFKPAAAAGSRGPCGQPVKGSFQLANMRLLLEHFRRQGHILIYRAILWERFLLL